jgi:L-arabinose transport system ATP-binding protein
MMPTETGRRTGRALSAININKGFVGVKALTDVSLDLPFGKVTALMGENGAGKSTFLKILTGDYRPDTGEIRIDGESVSFASPVESRQFGLRVVSQEPEIAAGVSVAENIYLGALPHSGPFIRRADLNARARADLERFGFGGMLSPTTLGARLSPAQRQVVEIVRCLADDPQIIAFDEPTSSLSDTETGILFSLIRKLRDEGRAVIYVSHRLKEVFEIADSVVVLRDGTFIGERAVAQTSEQEIVRMMVGRDLSSQISRDHLEPGEVVCELDHVTTDDVTDINLTVHAGEVVALAGLVGAGRSELARAIAGDRPVRSGIIRIKGTPRVFRDPGDAIAAGVGLAPEERKSDALVMVRSVRENMSLAVLRRFTRLGFISRRAEKAFTKDYSRRLNVKTPSTESIVGNLSGGNQQKVVLARWLAKDCDVLVLDEPTRGIDVGAKHEIYEIISELAAHGVAIILISSELPEVLALADRVAVMQDGRITGELSHGEATEEGILSLAMASDLTEEEGVPA